MRSVVIENFRHGVDARRSELTSVLGTLEKLIDGHINQGGEIEKRKAFVPTDLSTSIATFGFEALKDSIVIFGGDPKPAGWPPAGFTYQQLVRNNPHFDGTSCNNPTQVKAVDVIHSTVFGGKAFVLASMADGTTSAFYDGQLVTDINFFGQVLPGMTANQDLFCEMVQAINASGGFTGAFLTGNNGISIVGKPGHTFQTDLVVSSTWCSPPKPKFVSGTTPGKQGKVSTGYFTIFDGIDNGTNGVTAVNLVPNLGAGAPPILLLPVGYTEFFSKNAATTAYNLAKKINQTAASFTTGDLINALAVGNRVLLSGSVSTSADNDYDIQVSVNSGVMIANWQMKFAGTGFSLQSIIVGRKGNILASPPLVFPTPSTEKIEDFVGRVVTNVNGGTGTHNIIAMQRESVLLLSTQVTRSTDGAWSPTTPGSTRVDVVLTTTSGNWGVGTNLGVGKLVANITVSSLTIYATAPTLYANFVSGNNANGRGSISVLAEGGSGKYAYRWMVDRAFWLSVLTPNQATTDLRVRFDNMGASNTARPISLGLISCEVTDIVNGDVVVTTPVPVSVKLTAV